MKKNTLIFFFILLKSFIGYSQQYNFHNYSVADGVAQSQVYSLLQDSRGYLWIGTNGGGITRFDGVNFKTFSINDNLCNNYISCIKEDRNNHIWIGTNNGISEYNGIKFINYLNQGDTVVRDIAFDNQGRKWLATNFGIILLLQKDNYTNINDKIKEKRSNITAIHFDRSGSVWYGDTKGLYKISILGSNYSLKKIGKPDGFNNITINCIEEDKQGRIWIGTYEDGAYIYENGKFNRIDKNLELFKQVIFDIYFDTKNNVWFSTLLSGVAEYNLKTKTFSWLTKKEGLSKNNVRCVIQDKSGNYWFGTSGGGVCNYFGKQFTNFDKSSGLGEDYIYSIFRDTKKRLWIGTDNGLTVIDSDKFLKFTESNGFLNVKVKAIAEDNFGNLFFGTDGQGVYKYNGKEFDIVVGLEKKHIKAIIKDSKGCLWVATAGMGLYKVIENEEGTTLEHYTTNVGLLDDRLSCLYYDKLGRLWYGTENNGIGYFEKDKINSKFFKKKDGLPSNSIRCLTEDTSGLLWIGTSDNGIANFPLYKGDYKFKSYNYKDRLTSSNIYLLTTDRKNNLFIGTEKGLDYLILDKDRKLLKIKHYSKGEGFTGVEVCQNSVYNDSDGTIWFGTISGLSKYSPKSIVKNEFPPITRITDVKLFYTSISETKYKNFVGDWNTISNLELPYNQNHITFDFNAVNFSNPEAVQYQWKLEGFDNEWSPISNNHSILYSNLGSGNYTFMVKACNEDGVWNKEPISIKLYILPPFWLRWWFIALISIISCSLLFVFYKWRINRIKSFATEEQRKLQLEKEVIELEQKALRLQMNPHFIFNALNSIQSQIGINNEQGARYYLAKFSHLMRQILDNSRNKTITLEEEINTLENYLLIEKFCNGDRFEYKVTVDQSIERDFIYVPPMMLQPFIENSIKHGFKHIEDPTIANSGHNKKWLIEVNFKEINNILECSVTDNGIGRKKSEELKKMSKENYHKSTALYVTQERLDLLKITKNIVAMEILDLYDDNGNPKGTKVILRIPIN